MPSKQDVDTIQRNVLCKNNESGTTQDFLSRDVENLVYEIKENLRLSSLTMRHQKRPRPSPYSHTSRSNLKDLLRDGSLIKEAVKRLQRDYILPTQQQQQQQKYVYDSDDETAARSPFRFYQNLEI